MNPVIHQTAHRTSMSHKDNTLEMASKQPNRKKSNSQYPHVTLTRVKSIFQSIKKFGVHTVPHMSACGFQYTGNGNTACCKDCGLEVSNLTLDMNPFTIHSQRRSDCPFVCSMKASLSANISASSSPPKTTIRNPTTTSELENPSKRQKIELMDSESIYTTLLETDLIQQVRRRSFSHWSHRTIPSSAQMIEAGFFNCNVGDRVICIYCNLISQQWTPHTDDPCDVHKTLAPNCIYVKAKLIRPAASSIIIVNENATVNTSDIRSGTASNLGPLRSNDIVFTASCNPAYSEIPKRHASYATWPVEDLPPVDDLVRAGFFYTGTKTIVTCFYCNGSLQNWGPNDNPMIEHARWFPHCAYARQLCGDELYRKIQESKRAQQERARATESKDRTGPNDVPSTNTPSLPPTANSRQLLIPDESTLSRLVAARLDLPISQRLLDQNFKLSIIKRCWEDQLRLKHDDFLSECDLYMACLILQKQIENIDGKKENIVIPSIKMKQIREQIEARLREQTAPTADAEMTTSSQSLTNESVSSQSSVESTSKLAANNNENGVKITKQTTSADDRNQSTPSNPCVLCLTEEKRLACIPCGHMATSAYEYWTHGSSLIDVADKLTISSDWRPQLHETWRILVHGFRKQFAQPEKIQRIDAFSDRLKIKNKFCLNNKADCSVGLFESYEQGLIEQPKEVFVGRWICDGARHLIDKYDVRKRYFIGNTTMDATLSFVMANMGQCQPNHITLDPFCGTGGILLACAELGSNVVGSEFDWRVLTAKAKPTKANTKNLSRNPDEMMHRNFSDYGTLNRFLGVVGADFAYSPWRPTFQFDSIVTDPPYGIRESSQHKSRRRTDKADDDEENPVAEKYDLTNIYGDLLNFANVYLRVGGRLVFWMPTHILTYDESLLPTHPCFILFSNDEQQLNRTVSRRLLTMIKIRESNNNEKAQVNEKLFSNFRDLYFTPNSKIWEQLNSNNTDTDSSAVSEKENS
ncbi:unnamed protein product [Rotaria magnacalcarata]|uniref:tRNA (guanine(10)-N(2))-methyltransferase TRMT11 n=2 Tax=Rotaria magnacalcarata TaxID=392030 RepID=A0A819R423_9BILA|nr:unnamed protein product [Rotaria magnacalcarata]